MKIKLIALDLDGTTLRRDNTLSPRNRQALLAAMACGVLVVPATGRPYEKIPECIRTLPGVRYAVCSNGACAFDSLAQKSLYTDLLPFEVMCSVIEAGRPSDCFVEVYVEGKSYCRAEQLDHLQEYPRLSTYAAHVRSTRIPVKSLRAFVRQQGVGAEKVNLWPKKEETFQNLWQELFKRPEVTITSAGFGNVEINAAGCDKGKGLFHLCAALKISREEVMACGDNLNDAAMLRFAGEAVAMGNAPDEVKAIANHIAPESEDDGVAKMVEQLVLKQCSKEAF